MNSQYSTNPLYLSVGDDDGFYGWSKHNLDNLLFWSRALTDVEIANLNINYIPENDIIAYYKFNAGEGDILYDHSEIKIMELSMEQPG